MLFILPTLLLAASATALPRSNSCTFALTAIANPAGTLDPSPIGASSLGHNQLGGNTTLSTYTLTSDVLTDSSGAVCFIDALTSAFTCSSIRNSATSFFVADNGNLVHADNDSGLWLACTATEAPDSGIYGVFGDMRGNDDSADCVWIEAVISGNGCGLAPTEFVTAAPIATSVHEPGAQTAAATTTSCSAETPFASHL